MAREEFPIIRGQINGWAQIKVSLDVQSAGSVQTKDYSKIDWDDAVEHGRVPGTGPVDLGSTVGQYTANGSMAMYLDAFAEFQRVLATRSPRIATVQFNLFLAWVPLDGEGEMHKAELLGCKIAGRTNANAPGADATAIDVPLYVGMATLNGIRLI